MRNKGYTLIELMIVIACLGIILGVDGYYKILKQYSEQEKIILEQGQVLSFQKKLRKLLKESNTLGTITNRKLVTDKVNLSVSNKRNKVLLNGKLYEFDSFQIYNFRKINNCIKCDVKNGNQAFKLYLSVGKSLFNKSEEQIDDDKNSSSSDTETASDVEVSNE